MNYPLSPAQLEALRRLDACTLANAIETFHERLRNEGFMDNSVHCLFPRLQPMIGYAATIKIRGSAPPMGDDPYPDRTDWWDYVLSLPEPRVAVVQDVATRPGLGSLVGAVHMNILRALRCVGSLPTGRSVISLRLGPLASTTSPAASPCLMPMCTSWGSASRLKSAA